MLPSGTYPAVVVPVQTQHGLLACQFGKSKGKGTPQVVVAFEILRGPHAGQVISWFGYFTDNETATNRTLESLRICGFTGDDLDQFHAQKPENEVAIVVGQETYEGKLRAKVQWVNAPQSGFKLADPMNAGDLRTFGARFKSRLKSFQPVTTAKAERQPPGEEWSGNDQGDPPPPGFEPGGTPPSSDDDIPF